MRSEARGEPASAARCKEKADGKQHADSRPAAANAIDAKLDPQADRGSSPEGGVCDGTEAPTSTT